MNNLVILLVIIPFLASFLTLFEKYAFGIEKAPQTAIVATSCCLVLLIFLFPPVFKGKAIEYFLGGWKEPVGITIYMDGLSWIASFIGIVIGLVSLFFSWGEKKYEHKFYFFFLILLGGMEGAIMTGDIFNMFVFFEIVSIASYILIAYSKKTKSLMASFNYLLISSLGMGFFLLGIALLYQQTGIFSLRGIAGLKNQLIPNTRILNIAIISLVVGIGVKAAFFPLHTWLPDAHAFAPHPVSSILSGVMIKISFLAIWRIIRILDTPSLQHIFIWIGAFTALLGAIFAIAQSDCKKILAYHSISQMGFIIAGFGVATSFSLVASLYHILNHSLFKSLLFLSVGVVIYLTGKRKIDELAGFGNKIPFVKITFLVGALSICGVPPFNGYASKTLISTSLKDYPLAYFFIFMASAGTFTSFIKLSRIFRGKINQENTFYKEQKNFKEKIPKKMIFPLFTLSALCIITGLCPETTTGLISRLILNEKIKTDLHFYSLSNFTGSLFSLIFGLSFYLLIITQKGSKVMNFLRKTRPTLNSSLLLVVAGFLLIVVFYLLTGKAT